MLKAEVVIKKLGGPAKVAAFFGVSVAAVSNWKHSRKKCIPRERELELMLRLPEEFPHNGNGK